MITRSQQKWEVGQSVKVGFLTLTVVSIEPTPGDYRPDIYHLVSAKGQKYAFTPHYGIDKEF